MGNTSGENITALPYHIQRHLLLGQEGDREMLLLDKYLLLCFYLQHAANRAQVINW